MELNIRIIEIYILGLICHQEIKWRNNLKVNIKLIFHNQKFLIEGVKWFKIIGICH